MTGEGRSKPFFQALLIDSPKANVQNTPGQLHFPRCSPGTAKEHFRVQVRYAVVQVNAKEFLSTMNNNSSSSSWHTLGDLELTTGVDTDEAVHAWLVEILAPLNLSPDFQKRILRSAQESAGRTLQPDAEDAIPHIHISILVPRNHAPAGKPWGFFHIERIETGTEDGNERHHAIDFYLYIEGE